MKKIASFFSLGKSQSKTKEKRVYVPPVTKFYAPGHIFTEQEKNRKLENIKGERVSLLEDCIKGIDYVVTPMRLVTPDTSKKHLDRDGNEDICPCCYISVPKEQVHTLYIKYNKVYACENSQYGPAYDWDGDGIYDAELRGEAV